jgi:hypothetical protein
MIKIEAAKNFKPTPLQEEESCGTNATIENPNVFTAGRKILALASKKPVVRKHRDIEEITSLCTWAAPKTSQPRELTRDREEYFERIDARVKSKFPEVFGGHDRQAIRQVEPAKKPATVVASASRTTAQKTVKLTTTQAGVG